MALSFLDEIKDVDKKKAVELLVTNSSPRQSYYFLVASSVAMATMGMLMNSTAVVIGSMLIAPVLYPVLSLAMGIIISDSQLIGRSFTTILRSVLLSLIVSVGVAVLFSFQHSEITSEMVKRMEPSLINAAVALVSGLAVSYVIMKPNLNNALPGVAISVSLVPPLAVIGIGLAKLNVTMTSSALILFLVNIVGIMFTAMIIFSLTEFVARRREVHNEVVKDEEIVKKQSEKTEESEE
jgi:uncharacterized hydrophobic protein (TIGR00271 family)